MKQQMRNHTVQYSFCLRIMTHKKQTNMEIVSIHSATQILWQYYGSSYHLTLLFLMSKENVVSSFLSTIDLILGVGQGAASYQSAALGRGNRSIKCLPLALFLSRFLLQPTWARLNQWWTKEWLQTAFLIQGCSQTFKCGWEYGTYIWTGWL